MASPFEHSFGVMARDGTCPDIHPAMNLSFRDGDVSRVQEGAINFVANLIEINAGICFQGPTFRAASLKSIEGDAIAAITPINPTPGQPESRRKANVEMANMSGLVASVAVEGVFPPGSGGFRLEEAGMGASEGVAEAPMQVRSSFIVLSPLIVHFFF